MAKTQTFGDKLKKKKMDPRVNVKVIKWYHDPERGSLRSLERMIKLDDLSTADKADIIK
ncbi:MAG: hypothetical protein NT007_00695 [Candidatus Kapabacteria bacterium]|nr:hypothetical protein [Candidatus Kapabacteria bacterium]